MQFKSTKAVTVAAVLVFSVALTACGLPRSGPNKREIFSGSVQNGGNAHIVEVDDRITRATATVPAFGFSSDFLNAGKVGSDVIAAGDTLGLTIWENVDDGLLSSAGGGATSLNQVQVDGSGYIFVPYAGRIRAAGNTPEAIRRIITEKLDQQTPDPQVIVTRQAGDGATVTISGSAGGQGIFPIERPTRTLTAMLASSGGVSIAPEIAQVTVFRGNKRAKVWYQDLFSDPRNDIALRAGDRILIEADEREFITLGATGQSKVTFDSQTISAIEAIAQVGGLRSSTADPTGVFVIREEPEEIARAVLERDDLVGPQRLVYMLNLTQPNGLFIARDFAIRDGDTVYVTEAPFVQWTKTVNAVLGTLGNANTVSSLAVPAGG